MFGGRKILQGRRGVSSEWWVVSSEEDVAVEFVAIG
jgi:hypothetical protein